MSGRDRIQTGLAVFLLGGALCLQGSAQQAATDQSCKNQSPRRLENYNLYPARPSVRPGVRANTIVYTPPGGKPVTLQRCGQHYHCRIENLQPECPGQVAKDIGRPPICAQPEVGTWVEIHTVYAPKVLGEGCDKETLNCCVGEPVVVKGYHARVEAGGQPGPVPIPWSLPVAEWSGSNTGPDDYPGGCKPVPARWNFSLGCEFKVTWAQLGLFHHADLARGLQTGDRLSDDLALIKKP